MRRGRLGRRIGVRRAAVGAQLLEGTLQELGVAGVFQAGLREGVAEFGERLFLECEPGLEFDQAFLERAVAHASGLRTERPRPMP